MKTRLYQAIHLTSSLTVLLHIVFSVAPAIARVDRRHGECFERLISSSHITKRLGKCIVYVGTYGMDRALWGFVFPNDRSRSINAFQDVGAKDAIVNGKSGYMYSPSKRTPDALRHGQYFCLGYKGNNRMICGRPQGGRI